MLWAWDRAEDLRFLKPGEAEVAVLALTAWVSNGPRGETRWRELPLEVNEGTRVMAVVRLESNGSKPLQHAADVASQIQGMYARRPYSGLQIDFDARESERAWYTELLVRLGQRTYSGPGIQKISRTSTASWCLEKAPPVADGVTVTEVVPMLFRLGSARVRTLEAIRRQGGFTGSCGGGAIGLSTDEPLAWMPPGARRVYLFHPVRWTREAFDQACARWR